VEPPDGEPPVVEELLFLLLETNFAVKFFMREISWGGGWRWGGRMTARSKSG